MVKLTVPPDASSARTFHVLTKRGLKAVANIEDDGSGVPLRLSVRPLRAEDLQELCFGEGQRTVLTDKISSAQCS